MESTGVDGKPVYYLLEEDFTVLLVNEAHITNLPGRGRKKAIAAVAWPKAFHPLDPYFLTSPPKINTTKLLRKDVT